MSSMIGRLRDGFHKKVAKKNTIVQTRDEVNIQTQNSKTANSVKLTLFLIFLYMSSY
jgi:hypothetical protein